MTQPVIGLSAVAAAVAASAPIAPVEQGEPTMEELAALVGDPLPEPTTEEPATDPAATEETAPTKAEPAEATEVDAALDRANKAAAKAREGSRRYAAQQETLREQAQTVQRAAREAEQLRQENATAKAEREAYKKDPYKALKDAGMTDRDLAERALRENTPEAVTQRLQERIEASEARAEALEKRLADEQASAQRRQVVQRAEAEFTAAADDEAAFPELAKLTADGQLAHARLALAQAQANGVNTARLSTETIARLTEKYIELTRKPSKTAAAPAPVTASKPKPSGVTLTNKQAQTRTVAPANWDDLSDEQQIAHIASSLAEPG